MRVWRIATESRDYSAKDLSGGGAAKFPGRWNRSGEAMIYTASNISLAVLETMAHLANASMPLNRYLLAIDIPIEAWEARSEFTQLTAPGAWDAIPSGSASADHGSRWLAGNKSLVMTVPSVIVPEEAVVLLNPSHPAIKQVKVEIQRRYEYNRVQR